MKDLDREKLVKSIEKRIEEIEYWGTNLRPDRVLHDLLRDIQYGRFDK